MILKRNVCSQKFNFAFLCQKAIGASKNRINIFVQQAHKPKYTVSYFKVYVIVNNGYTVEKNTDKTPT